MRRNSAGAFFVTRKIGGRHLVDCLSAVCCVRAHIILLSVKRPLYALCRRRRPADSEDVRPMTGEKRVRGDSRAAVPGKGIPPKANN